jgi:hypothetical protein
MPDDSHRQDGVALPEVTGSEVGAVVGLLVAGPAGAAIGTVVTPAATEVARRLFASISERRAKRATSVLDAAARYAGVDLQTLLNRLDRTAEGEELLVQTIRVAQESALEGKLFALAAALARGGRAESGAASTETAFVRALGDCDVAHVRILEAFTRTKTGDHTLARGVMSKEQIGAAFPELMPMFDHIVATLQRHGLITVIGVAVTDQSSWGITDFGRDFLGKIQVIGQLVT